MTVGDNTIQVEGFGDFFKNLGKKGLNVSKNMAQNVLKILKELWKLWKLMLTLVVLLHPEALKQLYQACLKLYISIVRVQGFIWVGLYNYAILKGKKTDRIYPSAQLENIDLQQRLEKK